MSAAGHSVWMNGRLVPPAEAVVPFLTPALHYGAGVFEGIRCYATESGPAVFRLRDHIERLLQSARTFGFRELPYDADALCAAVRELVAANGLEECYIRPVMYLAEGGWNLTLDGGKPHVGIAVWPWTNYLGEEARERGVRANVSSFTRHHPNVSMTKAKVIGNYANSFLAKTESVRLGFDEAILLDPEGYVAECTGENLFLVRRDALFTPPSAGILDGITRQSVIALARDAGYVVREARVSRDDLYGADEVFVCGTAAEVIGLREIDFRVIGTGSSGPVTRALQRAYADAVHGRDVRSAEWLDYIRDPATEETWPDASPVAPSRT
jgi:branched-chain amino acid aminotransferase